MKKYQPITPDARKIISEDWTENTIKQGLPDTLAYLRSYEAALSAAESRIAELERAGAGESIELFAPCPFCGSREVGRPLGYDWVRCRDCGARGPQVKSRDDDSREIHRAWNKRAVGDGNPGVMHRQILQLRGALLAIKEKAEDVSRFIDDEHGNRLTSLDTDTPYVVEAKEASASADAIWDIVCDALKGRDK